MKALTIALAVLCTLFVLDYAVVHSSSQAYSEQYLNESLALATTTYATSRLINAGVSTLQETNVSMSPWGVGLSVQPGQILDPINDATERLSDLCVQSIGLLGVQRILLEVINEFTLLPLYLGLIAFVLLTALSRQKRLPVILLKLIILLALLRISTPLMCGVGQAADAHYFEPAIEESLLNLNGVKDILAVEFQPEAPMTGSNGSFDSDAERGTFETIKLFFIQMKASAQIHYARAQFRFQQWSEAIGFLKDHSLEIINDLTGLFAALLGKVAVQVFILPLTTLALIRWAFKVITDSPLDDFVDDCRQRLQRTDAPVEAEKS